MSARAVMGRSFLPLRPTEYFFNALSLFFKKHDSYCPIAPEADLKLLLRRMGSITQSVHLRNNVRDLRCYF